MPFDIVGRLRGCCSGDERSGLVSALGRIGVVVAGLSSRLGDLRRVWSGEAERLALSVDEGGTVQVGDAPLSSPAMFSGEVTRASDQQWRTISGTGRFLAPPGASALLAVTSGLVAELSAAVSPSQGVDMLRKQLPLFMAALFEHFPLPEGDMELVDEFDGSSYSVSRLNFCCEVPPLYQSEYEGVELRCSLSDAALQDMLGEKAAARAARLPSWALW
eukprot:Hpha_TRINITY_DN580_c0_g2::TRINITY_DN580_c0_g2_i1::g.171725::m.171725